MPKGRLLKYKLVGTALVLCGIFLVAKFKLHMIGLVMMFAGFYLAMKKGMRPR